MLCGRGLQNGICALPNPFSCKGKKICLNKSLTRESEHKRLSMSQHTCSTHTQVEWRIFNYILMQCHIIYMWTIRHSIICALNDNNVS